MPQFLPWFLEARQLVTRALPLVPKHSSSHQLTSVSGSKSEDSDSHPWDLTTVKTVNEITRFNHTDRSDDDFVSIFCGESVSDHDVVILVFLTLPNWWDIHAYLLVQLFRRNGSSNLPDKDRSLLHNEADSTKVRQIIGGGLETKQNVKTYINTTPKKTFYIFVLAIGVF